MLISAYPTCLLSHPLVFEATNGPGIRRRTANPNKNPEATIREDGPSDSCSRRDAG